MSKKNSLVVLNREINESSVVNVGIVENYVSDYYLNFNAGEIKKNIYY